MIQNPLQLKENVTKKPFKYMAAWTFTVRVMASGIPLDLKEDVFVKKICRIMKGYAKVNYLGLCKHFCPVQDVFSI